MAYWLTALALVVFGFLTGFSIGQPFLLVGLALLALGPVRHRRRIFAPVLVAVAAWNVGYWLFVPISCTTIASEQGGSHTTCTSILGPDYEGPGVFQPPREPALGAAAIFAAVGAAVTFVAVSIRPPARSRLP